MEILFRILHHQSELLPRVLDLGTFKNFAVACRNYNCIRAVQPAAKTWFKSSQPQSSSESLTYVAIAYLLDIPRAFRRLTGDLVLNSVESFLDQKLEDNVGGLLPIQVYGKLPINKRPICRTGRYLHLERRGFQTIRVPHSLKGSLPSPKLSESIGNHSLLVHLEHQRAVLRQIIADCLQEPVVSLVSMESRDRSLINNHYVSRASCSFVMHDALLARAYLGELYRLRVFPLEFDQMEIGVVLDKLSDFEEKSLSLDLRIPIHNYNDDCTACTFDSRNHIDELEKTIRSQALGLCLDCVRHGPSRGSECRVKHAWHHVGK